MPEKRNNPLKAKPKKNAQDRLKAAEEAKKTPEPTKQEIKNEAPKQETKNESPKAEASKKDETTKK